MGYVGYGPKSEMGGSLQVTENLEDKDEKYPCYSFTNASSSVRNELRTACVRGKRSGTSPAPALSFDMISGSCGEKHVMLFCSLYSVMKALARACRVDGS